MQFQEVFQAKPRIFYDGPMETRVEYETEIKLDREMSIFLLLETQKGREALGQLYRRDIETVMPAQAPLILNAPTFRASEAHCLRLGLPCDAANVYEINRCCIAFVKAIRAEYPHYASQILVTAPVGPKYAGFTPDNTQNLAAEIAYHQTQIKAIAEIGVDVISIAAMPGRLECLGAAIAANQTKVDYTVGFVVTKNGTLLDGTPIEQLIEDVDRHCERRPIGYIIGCSHPSIAEQALSHNKPEFKRIIGIKANGSARPPKELLKLQRPEADAPALFAKALHQLGTKRGFKIYGGCCGTDHTHLQAMIMQFNMTDLPL